MSGLLTPPGEETGHIYEGNPMNPDKAIELINNDISYKPNFRFQAARHTNFHDAVFLHITYAVPNSDPEYAPEYFDIGDARRSFTLFVTGLDEDGLYELILQCLLQIETHECREFFGIGGNQYIKPFHPHTPDGITNWRNLRPMHIIADVFAGDNLPITLTRKEGTR